MAINYDAETGEVTESVIILNEETGEFEMIQRGKQPPFKISNNRHKLISNTNKSSCENKQKKKTSSSTAEIAAIIFLLPTTVFFYPSIWVLLLFIEGITHLWVHKKNKKLQATNIRYISPLHILVKEFCGVCREEENSIKMKQIHQKGADRLRKYGLDYVRRIVT